MKRREVTMLWRDVHRPRSVLLRGVLLWPILAGCAEGAADARRGFVGPGEEGEGGADAAPAEDASFPRDDGGPLFSGDGGVLACSGDLQQVVDEHGTLVRKCPPDQGCAAGACVAACDAAAVSHGTVGCDFVQATPSFTPAILSPCWAVFIANGWGKAARLTVRRGATSYDVTKFGRIPAAGTPEWSWPAVPAAGLPPGQVAVLFMSSDPAAVNGKTSMACPVPDALDMATAVYTGANAATGIGQAWHVSSDVPVSAYDILPYGGAKTTLPSAELLLPTTAWGTNYVSVVPPLGYSFVFNGTPVLTSGPQWTQIVAATDGTTVRVVPVTSLPGGAGVNPAPANTVAIYKLDAGQFVQWQDSGDMSGTIIASDKPIGVNAGNGLACYASSSNAGQQPAGGCDASHQQLFPLDGLGFEYAVAPYTTRRRDLAPESIAYRLVGTVAGTLLTYDPPVAGAPGAIDAGQVVDFETPLAFVVRSQDASHPFSVTQIMSGGLLNGGSRPGNDPANTMGQEICGVTADGGAPIWCAHCLGDEESVNLVPPAQFLDTYVFFTDPTYATTNLVFVRKKGSQGFQDVSLDCAGTLAGWRPIGASGTYETTNVDLLRGFVPSGACNNGPHTATSKGVFGLMVWGLDYAASYAYPAGGNVAPINTVVVPPTPR